MGTWLLHVLLHRDLEAFTQKPRHRRSGWWRGFWSGAPEGTRTPNLLIRSSGRTVWMRPGTWESAGQRRSATEPDASRLRAVATDLATPARSARRPYWRRGLLLDVTFGFAVALSVLALVVWLATPDFGAGVMVLLVAWYVGFQFIPKRGRRRTKVRTARADFAAAKSPIAWRLPRR